MGTWIPGGEVEVGEIDDIVVALLLLVEETDLGGPSNHVVSYHALNTGTYLKLALKGVSHEN